MSENTEVAAAPVLPLRWVKIMLGVSVVLSLGWLFYYLRELHGVFDPWLEAKLSFMPAAGAKLLAGIAGYAALLVPPLVVFVLSVRIGLLLEVRRLVSPEARLAAYRRGSAEGAARARANIDRVLRDAKDLSPAEAAELRVELEESMRRIEEDAERRHKLYEENPALLENEVRMTIESIRAKQQAGGS